MEQNVTTVEEPNTTPTEPEMPEKAETPPEKLFTQAELDRRIRRATKDMPDKEELAAFRQWRESQKTEQERVAGIIRERDENLARFTAAEAEIERLKQERYVFTKGLSGDEAEFVVFKALKMVGDDLTFEEAVDCILAKKAEKETTKQPIRFDWTASVGAGSHPASGNDRMNDIIRNGLFGRM